MTLQPVPTELLDAVAGTATDPAKPHPSAPSSNGRRRTGAFDLGEWMARHFPDARGPEPHDGGRRWVLRECPWNQDHNRGEAFIIERANGAIAAGCQHNSCASHGWSDLREQLEPGRREVNTHRDGRVIVVDDRQGATTDNGTAGQLQQGSHALAAEWPSSIDEAAYHGVAGQVVRTIAPHTESDPAALLIQFLAMFGNIIGRNRFFRVEADRHYPNLFAVLVGQTAKGRKGTSLGHIVGLLEPIDREWVNGRKKSGLSSGEGLIYNVRDSIEKVGKEGEIIVQDEGVADKRLMVVESEFASVLRTIGREGNTLSPILRDAWDRGDLSTLTKNSPTSATGAHIAVIGHITKDELRRYLTTTEVGNGLANRFLWVCVRRSKVLPEGGNLDPGALEPLRERVRRAILFANQEGEIRRDERARGIWSELYPELSEGKPGLLGSIVSRAEAQVVRLSLIYALLDCSECITAEHMMAAVALWEYTDTSATYLFGDSLGDPLADDLLRLIREAPAGVTKTQIRDHFGRNMTADRVNAALNLLGELNRVRCETAQTNGRPTTTYIAV